MNESKKNNLILGAVTIFSLGGIAATTHFFINMGNRDRSALVEAFNAGQTQFGNKKIIAEPLPDGNVKITAYMIKRVDSNARVIELYPHEGKVGPLIVPKPRRP